MRQKNDISLIMRLNDGVTSVVNKISSSINGFKKDMDKFNLTSGIESINKASNTMRNFGKNLSIAGAAITAGGVFLSVGAEDYNKELSKVALMTGETIKDIKEKYGNSILNLSLETGIDQSQLVSGVIEGIKSGLTLDDAMSTLEKQAKISFSGFSDIVESMGLGASISKSYGVAVSDIDKINDILMASLQKSGLTYNDVSAHVSNAVKEVSKAGVSFENLQATAVKYSMSGVDIGKAYSSVVSVVQQISAPTRAATEEFRRLGISLNADALKKGDLIGSLELLKESMKDLDDMGKARVIGNIFSGEDAKKFALDYINAGDAYKEFNLSIVNHAKNQGADAFAASMGNFSDSFNKLKNSLTVLRIIIGETILPTFRIFVNQINKIINTVSKLVQKYPNLSRVVGGSVFVFGAVTLALGATFSAIGAVLRGYVLMRQGAFALRILSVSTFKLGKSLVGLVRSGVLLPKAAAGVKVFAIGIRAFTLSAWGAVKATIAWTVALLTNPITWIVIGVVGLIAALVLLQKKFNIFGLYFKWLKSAVSGIVTVLLLPRKILLKVLGVIFSLVKKLFGWMKKFTVGFYESFKKDPLGTLKKALMKQPIVLLFKALSSAIDKIPFLSGAKKRIVNAVKSITDYLLNAFKRFKADPLAFIKDAIMAFINNNPFKLLLDKVDSTLNSLKLVDIGKKWMISLKDGLVEEFNNSLGVIGDILSFFGFGASDKSGKKVNPPVSKPLANVSDIASSAVAGGNNFDNSIVINYTSGHSRGPIDDEKRATDLAKAIEQARAKQLRVGY